jgi:hypothetical protein
MDIIEINCNFTKTPIYLAHLKRSLFFLKFCLLQSYSLPITIYKLLEDLEALRNVMSEGNGLFARESIRFPSNVLFG